MRAPEECEWDDTAVEVEAKEYEGLQEGSLRTMNPFVRVPIGLENGSLPAPLSPAPSSSSCCRSCLSSRGKTSGVPFTDMTVSLCRACRLGYVGVLGGKMGLNTVEAGLNWDIVVEYLTGETGRDTGFEGEVSTLATLATIGFGCNPTGGRVPFADGRAAFPMGLEKRGRLGVALVGEAGTKRAAE